jgi:hypothetical protein
MADDVTRPTLSRMTHPPSIPSLRVSAVRCDPRLGFEETRSTIRPVRPLRLFPRLRPLFLLALASLAGAPAACSSSSGGGGASAPTLASFDLHVDLAKGNTFWDFPYPSDLRTTASGAPDTAGFPSLGNASLVADFGKLIAAKKGFPVIPVAYFKFDHDLAEHHLVDVLPSTGDGAVAMLVDVDPASPKRGELVPVVAETPPPDNYVPDPDLAPEGGKPVRRLLALAARPGFILAPNRMYAFVLMSAFGDASGKPLGVPAQLTALRAASAPSDAREAKAWNLYQNLWTTLATLKVDAGKVAAATVFTTGAPVERVEALSSKAIAANTATISGLKVRTDGNQTRNCELVGTISYPQFQDGAAPFDKGGVLQIGEGGAPIKQRVESAPIGISLPQQAMPGGGYPLIVYVHGSGGLSTQLFDRGPYVDATTETPHQGPAYVMAAHGFAMAGSAMPVNPERVPGAKELAYINFNNLASFPGTFVQGAIEQRMFIDALSKLTIDPSVVASCTGVSLPAGATSYKFDVSKLVAQGQSMGGQYVNMLGGIEPRVKALVPTGAGGYWSYVVVTTQALPNAMGLVQLLINSDQELTPMHPMLHLLETAWEEADALVYTPRLAKSPLPGHPSRPIYEPVGLDDEYFATPIYDAMAIAYGNKQAGEQVWPTMQTALALDGRSGMLSYPITDDLTSDGGSKYTGAVMQYHADAIVNSHYIFQQLDAVKYQYGCFVSTFVKRGTATIPAPAALGTPCP